MLSVTQLIWGVGGYTCMDKKVKTRFFFRLRSFLFFKTSLYALQGVDLGEGENVAGVEQIVK